VIDGRSWRSGWNLLLCESSQLRFEVDRARLDFERSTTFEGLLSFSLPQISYLTLIDQLFITTYAFIAINGLSASVESLLTQAG